MKIKNSNPLTKSIKIYPFLQPFGTTHFNHIQTYYLQVKNLFYI